MCRLPWRQVREVGDGNINFVYVVEGPAGGLVLKQGLPYIRIARDWPLTQVARWAALGSPRRMHPRACIGCALAESGKRCDLLRSKQGRVTGAPSPSSPMILSQDRVRIEAEALQEQARHCPEHVPEIYHYDAQVRAALQGSHAGTRQV